MALITTNQVPIYKLYSLLETACVPILPKDVFLISQGLGFVLLSFGGESCTLRRHQPDRYYNSLKYGSFSIEKEIDENLK